MKSELAPRPHSLFDGAVMKKTTKSVLSEFLENNVNNIQDCPEDSAHVLDGGHFLYQVVLSRSSWLMFLLLGSITTRKQALYFMATIKSQE